MSRAINIIYPRRCPVCDGVVGAFEFRDGRIKRGGYAHRKCLEKIEYVTGPTCFKCGKPLAKKDDSEYCSDCKQTRHVYTRGFSVFRYRSVSGSVYRFKYMGRQEYADFYAKESAKRLKKRLMNLHIDAIVPVPMYAGKARKRGYNQAEVYAKALSRELEIPLETGLITRVKDTNPMKELDVSGRRINLKKAFNITRNDVKLKSILIVDDIYTTGSTIDEIARQFRKAGVENIYFLTLAIGQTT